MWARVLEGHLSVGSENFYNTLHCKYKGICFISSIIYRIKKGAQQIEFDLLSAFLISYIVLSTYKYGSYSPF